MYKLSSFMLLIFTLGSSIDALAAKARIDILTGNSIELRVISSPGDGGSASNIAWGDEDKRKFAIFAQTAELPSDKWVEFSFSFVPKESGWANIKLQGNFSSKDGGIHCDQNWIYFDALELEGASVLNGDFEDATEDLSFPLRWWFNTTSDGKTALYIKDKQEAASGERCVKVWHNCVFGQKFMLTKGQRVLVKAMVRSGESIPAEIH